MPEGRRVLITGGCGFVGCNLARRLAAQGDAVRLFDNLSRGSVDFVAGIGAELLVGDILDEEALARAMQGVDCAVHLAAWGSVVESVAAPLANFRVNARGTLNVLRAAQAAGVRRVAFASTAGALMGAAPPPVSEASLPQPISPYGASKLCGEAYCHAFAGSLGLETAILRFGNIYGPWSARKKGAVTAFAKALMRGAPIEIYGDGAQSRDFLHVSDLCEGIAAAIDAPLPSPCTVHLASGVETTVLRLAETMMRIAGKPDHPIRLREARRGEVERVFTLTDRARELLGFSPKRDLETGLRETWAWFLANRAEALSAVEDDA